MKWFYLVVVLAVVFLAGCIGGEPEPLPPEMQQAAAPAETPAATPPAPSAQAAAPVVPPPAPAPEAAQPAVPPPVTAQPAAPMNPVAAGPSEEDLQWATPADLGGIQQAAAAGMGKQGRGYGGDIVTEPVVQYFRIRQLIGIDQIKHAMELYKGLNERYPRTQEEFRKEIIKANAVVLPVLPEGHKYYYDGEKAQLMVIRPR